MGVPGDLTAMTLLCLRLRSRQVTSQISPHPQEIPLRSECSLRLESTAVYRFWLIGGNTPTLIAGVAVRV